MAKKAPKKKVGRPTKYTPQLAKTICDRIATGESVRSIGRDATMPSATVIFNWALFNKEFLEQYAQARMLQAENEFEELDEIARTEKDLFRARLIIDTKKWALSKKLPKKYGDKLDLTSGGEKLPTPLLDYAVRNHHSDTKDSETE